MEKLFIILAVFAGIIIGAFIITYRSGINDEPAPSPFVEIQGTPSNFPTPASPSGE